MLANWYWLHSTFGDKGQSEQRISALLLSWDTLLLRIETWLQRVTWVLLTNQKLQKENQRKILLINMKHWRIYIPHRLPSQLAQQMQNKYIDTFSDQFKASLSNTDALGSIISRCSGRSPRSSLELRLFSGRNVDG